MNLFQTFLKPALFTLDPEAAHNASIKALKSGLLPSCAAINDPRLVQSIGGLNFPNPLGLAAGYDKNAEVPDAVLKLGFGFTEIGTITPRAQTGNPKPRMFRLVNDQGVINRLGFNNAGHDAALKRLEVRKENTGIVGINIGANKDSQDFTADYETGIKNFAHLANYFTVNISSPNTPGLRNLQTAQSLTLLLERIFIALDASGVKNKPPVFLKLAPDLISKDIKSIAKVVNKSSLSGLMVSNTTLARNGLLDTKTAEQQGGLSGRPLFERSTIVLARFAKVISKDIPLIGIGGIDSAETAWQKMEAGASLLQLYSGMIYNGPGLPNKIIKGLTKRLDQEGISHINDIVGTKTDVWAKKKLPEELG
ncbi:MAG: dihydroorotate dehydrogenase (quinone) [Hyphomicrobiales bacterium]|nr:quinone-dependent dihydroorotate dehydrogenase [Hyphomicrobiales bacterium]PCH49585.1 MAG: dihydroorotate dehydrogenase (quinone) [Hyphomicrobiales bacterium]